MQVAKLIDPTTQLTNEDISISHRLPANDSYTPAIIVKFTRRDVRDRIYSWKRNVNSKNARNLGFEQDSRLYINESLTQKSRDLLKEVKAFKRDHFYKFAWTKQGKVLLKKSDI